MFDERDFEWLVDPPPPHSVKELIYRSWRLLLLFLSFVALLAATLIWSVVKLQLGA